MLCGMCDDPDDFQDAYHQYGGQVQEMGQAYAEGDQGGFIDALFEGGLLAALFGFVDENTSHDIHAQSMYNQYGGNAQDLAHAYVDGGQKGVFTEFMEMLFGGGDDQ